MIHADRKSALKYLREDVYKQINLSDENQLQFFRDLSLELMGPTETVHVHGAMTVEPPSTSISSVPAVGEGLRMTGGMSAIQNVVWKMKADEDEQREPKRWKGEDVRPSTWCAAGLMMMTSSWRNGSHGCT